MTSSLYFGTWLDDDVRQRHRQHVVKADKVGLSVLGACAPSQRQTISHNKVPYHEGG